MTNTSDLLPQGSGTASLGVNQMNRTGFDAGRITPYGHMHMNSGVFHDPLLGQSGIFRFVQNPDLSYIEDDGFGADHEHYVAGRQNGFEISVDGGMTFPLLIGATHAITSGTGGGESLMSFGGGGGGASLEAHIDTAQEPHQVAVIRSQDGFRHDLYVYSSGVATIVGSRKLRLCAFGSIDDPNDNNNDIDIFSAHDIGVDAFGEIAIRSANNNILLEPGINTGNGDVILYAADSNSWLHFRKYGIGNAFGGDSPHQAWHVRNSVADVPGGPLGNGEWPIAHSGQVAAMIAAAGGGSQSLQAAYDGGDAVIIDRNPSDRNEGVLIREQNGKSHFGMTQAPSLAHLDYGIAVSGGLGSNNNFALTKLVPNGVYIKSSGTSTLSESSFVLGYNSAATPQTAFIASNHDLAFFALRNISYTAGTANQPGGQINLSAFVGSGQIEYRYGPYQSWAMKVRNVSTGGPAGDGFHPIPHSGQITAMILGALSSNEEVVFTQNGGLTSENTFKYYPALDEMGLSGSLRLAHRSASAFEGIVSGVTRVIAVPVARREYLEIVGSGLDATRLQPTLDDRLLFMVSTNNTTTLGSIGDALTSVGTISHPAATQTGGYMWNQVTGATAGNTCGTGGTNTPFFRGNARGINTGFFYKTRILLPDATYDRVRLFCGVTNQTMAASVGSDNPAGNFAGFQFSNSRGDLNWQFMTKDNVTQRVQDTGIHCSGSRVYDLAVYCPPFPNNNEIYWQIDDLTSPASASGVAIANLPAVNTAMRAGIQLSNVVAVARNLRAQKIYVEGIGSP